MQQVKVNKNDLMGKLVANREAHRSMFLEAQKGYRQDVIKEFDQMLAEAREGKKIRRAITLPEPMDQTSDYDRVIAMLKMSVDENVVLSAQEFNNYVMDNWSWKQQFLTSNSGYIK